MATLKKLTRVGSDVRQIARLLQAKAPEGHMLAYITPEEAELLKSRGGSGKEHADTGIPSFEYDADSYYSVPEAGTPVSMGTPQIADLPPAPAPENTEAFRYPSGFDAPVPYSSVGAPVQSAGQSRVTAGDFGPAQDRFAGAYKGAPVSLPDFAGQTRVSEGLPEYTPPFLPPAMTAAGVPTQFDVAREPTSSKSIVDTLTEKTGLSRDTLARLGIGGAQALLGGLQARKASQEARKTKEEQQRLAAPYQAKGAELQRQAQAGELTPVGQQQLQAVQAQAAQQASARGGAVGAAQTQAQIEALRSQLLQQQYDYGLKLSGIGDQIALGAIKTGLQADQYANQLTASYFGNIARTVYGTPTVRE